MTEKIKKTGGDLSGEDHRPDPSLLLTSHPAQKQCIVCKQPWPCPTEQARQSREETQ